MLADCISSGPLNLGVPLRGCNAVACAGNIWLSFHHPVGMRAWESGATLLLWLFLP